MVSECMGNDQGRESMNYTASTEDMAEYANLIAALTRLDVQRQDVVNAIGDWERRHQVEDIETSEPPDP